MADNPEWHLNSHKGQKGPYTARYIQDLWDTGVIHGACHVWRNGFDTWQELRAVDTFHAPDVDVLPESSEACESEENALQNERVARLAMQVATDDSMRPRLYRCLKEEGILLLVSYGLPAGLIPGLNVARSDLEVTVATGKDSDDNHLLLSFTSETASRKRFPSAECIGLESRNVLEMVLKGDHSGLLLDPGGAGIQIPRADIEDMLTS